MGGMTVRVRCLSLAILCLLIVGVPASAQPLLTSQDRLEQWLDAVREHEPGTEDAAFETVASWSTSDVRALWSGIERLIQQMRGENGFSFRSGRSAGRGGGGRNGGGAMAAASSPARFFTLSCAAAGKVTDTVCLNAQPPAAVASPNLLLLSKAVDAARHRGDGDNYILRRGALLHADVAMLAAPVIEAIPDTATTRQRYRVNIVDGRQMAFGQLPVHWQLARMLLDNVKPPSAKRPAPGSDAMVRMWYRATATWMQWHADYETAHLQRAREIFPTDPDLLFLSACIHETYAGNRIQNAIHALVLPPGVQTSVGSPRDELRTAERFLRRALDARPSFIEAQLHMGRVLSLLGRPADAVGHLTKAIAATDDQLLLYYGHLFLGAGYQAVRQDPQSRAAYERAASLFPRAQAPHLGLSQLARRRGERAAALDAMQAVFKIGAAATSADDPWWWYYTSQGRGADDLLSALRRPFLSGDPQ